ncbi:MAG: hypothetical protein ACKOET_10515 [Verrucomicrobiota bacterium]
MKRSVLILSTLVFLLFLAAGFVAVAGGLKFTVEKVRQWTASLEPQTAIILGTASLVALVGAWLVSSAIRSSTRDATTFRSRQARGETYVQLLECTLRRMQGEAVDAQLPPLEAALFVRGAAAVAREYQCLNEMLASAASDSPEVEQQLQALVAAMRRDHGMEGLLPVPARHVEANTPAPTPAHPPGDLIFEPARRPA